MAGQPFRTVLVARDSRGRQVRAVGSWHGRGRGWVLPCITPRQARPAACDALRVGVDLSGKAHLSGAAALAEMKCHTNFWGCN